MNLFVESKIDKIILYFQPIDLCSMSTVSINIIIIFLVELQKILVSSLSISFKKYKMDAHLPRQKDFCVD